VLLYLVLHLVLVLLVLRGHDHGHVQKETAHIGLG
jgi:hypothetical protein